MRADYDILYPAATFKQGIDLSQIGIRYSSQIEDWLHITILG
jgi:hypothetical protein